MSTKPLKRKAFASFACVPFLLGGCHTGELAVRYDVGEMDGVKIAAYGRMCAGFALNADAKIDVNRILFDQEATVVIGANKQTLTFTVPDADNLHEPTVVSTLISDKIAKLTAWENSDGQGSSGYVSRNPAGEIVSLIVTAPNGATTPAEVAARMCQAA